jgi:hypothetical protein
LFPFLAENHSPKIFQRTTQTPTSRIGTRNLAGGKGIRQVRAGKLTSFRYVMILIIYSLHLRGDIRQFSNFKRAFAILLELRIGRCCGVRGDRLLF